MQRDFLRLGLCELGFFTARVASFLLSIEYSTETGSGYLLHGDPEQTELVARSRFNTSAD